MDNKNRKINPFASFGRTLLRLIVPERKTMSILEEEAVTTPGRTILKNLFRNKLGILGMVLFISVFLLSFIGSVVIPLSENYTELTVANAKPGQNYLKVPKSITQDTKKIVEIVSGSTFSAALTDDGKITMWGQERNTYRKAVSDPVMVIPAEVQNAFIVDIEAGGAHMLAIDNEGKFYGWGNYSNDQTNPDPVANAWAKDLLGGKLAVSQLMAQQQWSAVFTEQGYMYLWGSLQAVDRLYLTKETRGRVVKAASGDNNMALLLDDGTLRIIGEIGSEYYASFPAELADGSVTIVDVVSSNRNVLALDDTGKLWLWGSAQDGLNKMPEIEGKVAQMGAANKNFWVVLEDGSVVVWGAGELGQLDVPANMGKIEHVYAGYSKFYAIDTEGALHTWGNKGYFMGSDEYGRDVFTRIIHGGRISLTVGAIAVLISIVIAMIIGMISGFYGGWVDMVLMRFADIVGSIPFLPIAITLSAVIGHKLTSMQKLYMIMVIIGVLGWVGLARLIRATILLEREKDFVLAARTLGIKQGKIITRHILPNVFNMIIVSVTLAYANALLTEAGLSFLGYGVTSPTPSWGNMLQSAQQTVVIEMYWWRWFIPAIFVILAALSVNLIGDALREAMDPKSNER